MNLFYFKSWLDLPLSSQTISLSEEQGLQLLAAVLKGGTQECAKGDSFKNLLSITEKSVDVKTGT